MKTRHAQIEKCLKIFCNGFYAVFTGASLKNLDTLMTVFVPAYLAAVFTNHDTISNQKLLEMFATFQYLSM